ncbi:FAD_syn domain-containing protein [Cephalotus follicularis]|uniref:FAD synthase n=1 Tax=Cephalotus follicularis TaxID=3775 RepID=A0A1Q3BWM0_CEPFO|nr:FAD_syn domain-containing protein [Cephalotus follicularis]
MMGGGGSRISWQHVRYQSLGLGPCSTVKLSSLMLLKPPSSSVTIFHRHRHRLQQQTTVSSSSLQSKSPGEVPIFSDSFSQPEDDHQLPCEGLSPVAGGIVALGKFDALHIGHRELAIEASKVGTPYLLSFVGMAEVLGWEPRAPIVAKCDRKRVLSSWAPSCGSAVPEEFQIKFATVRHLSARQFVEKLSKELGVRGVVAGENYRFGYKASGDASDLVRLCEEYGMGTYIIRSVMDKNQDPRNIDPSDLKDRGQVSSTRVRHALAEGDMKYVSELLGRQHRLIVMVKDQEGIFMTSSNCRVSAPKSDLLNLPPKDGLYENCSLFFGDENPVKCRVFIDSAHVHLDMDAPYLYNYDKFQDFEFLGIEFGEIGVA